MSAKFPINTPWPGQRLAGSISAIRKTLPLPLEQVNEPDPAAEAALSRKILEAADSQAIIQLSHTMTSRELNLVFPLLAAQGYSKRPSLLETRCMLIIRERACPTLYISGWLAFQKHFPCPSVAQALTTLCRILQIKQKSQSSLITQLVSPHSRQFVRRLSRHLVLLGLPLNQAMQQYDIRDDQALGAELIAQYFLTGDDSAYQDGQKLFAKALQLAGSASQVKLLHHFFNSAKLQPAIYNRCCQVIYRQYGSPSEGHAIWNRLKPRDCQLFQKWVLAATIGSHCRKQPDKARLYLRYAPQVCQVGHWDPDTLLIHFPEYVIADSKQSPLLALFYNQEDSKGHPFELATGEFSPNPANPAIPHRQVEDAIRQSNWQGVIGLPFDAEGIKLTAVFLGMCLKEKKHAGRWWLKRT